MGTLGSTCLVISMCEISSHPGCLLFQMLCLIALSKAAHSMWSVDVAPGNEGITVELWMKHALGTVEKANNWRRAPRKWAVRSTETLFWSHCPHWPDLPLASRGHETPAVEGKQLLRSACITAAAVSFYLTPEWAPERSFHGCLLRK